MASLSARVGHGRPPVPAGRALGVFLLGLFLFARFGDAFRLPFLNDDYVFLDHVRGKSFASLWSFRELAFHWWRPWSREVHYWWLERAFGPVEWPFHLMSLLLACAVLAAFWALARRLAGAPAAAIAVAGAATLPGWGLMLMWPAGAQDLWMLLLSLLALLAWRAGRVGWATLAYALALASKETAAPVLLLFLLLDRWVIRRTWPESLLRLLPSFVVALLWTLAHPLLLGRLWLPVPASLPPSPAAIAPWWVAVKSGLAAFSLDLWPHPDGGWQTVWWDGVRGALLLVIFVELLARPDARPSNFLGGASAARLRGTLPFALAWWACGTLPLLLPGLGWHAYYAQFAALGAWLAVGRVLSRHTGTAMALLGVLGFLGAGRSATSSLDWGEAAYQRRAGAFVSQIKERLLGAYPRMEPHARLWFVRLPNNVGFLAGDGPAVRVWYRDPTLQAGYYSAYRPRAAHEPAGPDHFFRVDEAGQFLEVKRADTTAVSLAGAPVDSTVQLGNPRWQTDQLSLASAMVAGRDWRGAAAEYRRLALAFPDSSGYAFDAATAFMQAGDSAAAYSWLAEAARRPGAPPDLVAAVRARAEAAPDVPPAKPRARRRLGAGKHAHEPEGQNRR
jgi:hypothetical protein